MKIKLETVVIRGCVACAVLVHVSVGAFNSLVESKCRQASRFSNTED